jgi:hypothetical protein
VWDLLLDSLLDGSLLHVLDAAESHSRSRFRSKDQ